MRRRPEPNDLVAAAIGFGLIFLLVTGASAFSYLAGNHAQIGARTLVTESGQTAYLVGRVGRDLSRMHADTLEALTEPAETVGPLAERIARVNADLERVMVELEPRLSDAQLAQWQQVRSTVFTVRADLSDAMADIQAGRPATAENLLDRDAVLMAWLFDRLENLSELSRTEARRSVDAMDAHIAAAGRLQTLAFVVLLLCTLVVGTAVVRELRRQRAELGEYLNRVEHANEDLEAFAGRIAHDLKNLLTPVFMAPRQLVQAAGDAHAVDRIAGRLDRASRRAVDLLEGLLAFAKAGKPPGVSAALVGVEVEQVLEELAPLADQVRASVEVDVAAGAACACSPALLHVVVLNLLSNALKFLEGRDRRWVRLRAEQQQGQCVLEVADSGPGIPRELRARVFEPFFRAPGVSAPGTGIGLATVQRIVTAHGGAVVLESVEGEGTKVRVQLPGAPSRPSDPDPDPDPDPDRPHDSRRRPGLA